MSIRKSSGPDLEVSGRLQSILKTHLKVIPQKSNLLKCSQQNSHNNSSQFTVSDNPIKLKGQNNNYDTSSTNQKITEKIPHMRQTYNPGVNSRNFNNQLSLNSQFRQKNHHHSCSSTDLSFKDSNSTQSYCQKTSYHRKASSQSDIGLNRNSSQCEGVNGFFNSRKLSVDSCGSLSDNGYYYNKIIKIEDLFLLEERLDDIIQGINIPDNNYEGGVSSQCFEWWMFYFNSSLVEKYKFFFWENSNKVIIHSANNLELFSIILAYHISCNINLMKTFRAILKSMFYLINTNFLLIIRQIIANMTISDKYNTYFRRLEEILQSNQINESLNERNIIAKINKNCSSITEYIKQILSQYRARKIPNTLDLIGIFNIISKIGNSDINQFFFDKILSSNKDSTGPVVNEKIIEETAKKPIISPPYIKTPLKKKFSLILDIDETLVNFKFKSQKDNSGVLYLRPGLMKFLSEIKKFYELISFTAATREYADPIIDVIEGKEKIFDYKFYREHAVLIGKEFVKDLSKIGRDLNKLAVVDNNSMNFRLHPENGILIYPYYYQNKDFALNELKKILIAIVMNGFSDIRKGIQSFKNEIVMKVSSNYKGN